MAGMHNAHLYTINNTIKKGLFFWRIYIWYILQIFKQKMGSTLYLLFNTSYNVSCLSFYLKIYIYMIFEDGVLAFLTEASEFLSIISYLLFNTIYLSISLYLKITLNVMIFKCRVLAFLMEASEFLLVSHTSSLTLSIAGIFKEVNF